MRNFNFNGIFFFGDLEIWKTNCTFWKRATFNHSPSLKKPKQGSIFQASQWWFTCKKVFIQQYITIFWNLYRDCSFRWIFLSSYKTNKQNKASYVHESVIMSLHDKLTKTETQYSSPFLWKKIYAKLKLEACLDSEKKQIVCCKHVNKGIFKCPLYLLKIKTKNPKGSNPGLVKPFLSIKVLKDVTKYCKQLRNYMLKFTQFQYETKLDFVYFLVKDLQSYPPVCLLDSRACSKSTPSSCLPSSCLNWGKGSWVSWDKGSWVRVQLEEKFVSRTILIGFLIF